MRSWVKMLLAASLSCVLGLGVFGCSSAPDDEYVGTWAFESVTDGDGVQDEESTAFVNSLGVTEEVTLNADGTGTLHLFGESRNFVWDRNDEAQEVTMTLEGETATLQLVDGKLRMEGQQEDGGVGYFVFVKNIGNEDAMVEGDASEVGAGSAESDDASAPKPEGAQEASSASEGGGASNGASANGDTAAEEDSDQAGAEKQGEGEE